MWISSPLTAAGWPPGEGARFAGIAAARALRRADAEIILIGGRNHHIFQPLLHQVATAVLAPAEAGPPAERGCAPDRAG